MSTRRSKAVTPALPPTTVGNDPGFDRHVQIAVRATVGEAERALEGAWAVLAQAGLLSRGSSTLPVPLPFLLKLAACVRLRQWEQANLSAHLPTGLPSSAEVWDDLLNPPRTGPERFPAKDLALRVFRTWYGEMAWAPPAAASDVMVSAVGAGVIDELAELLFKFRHLVEQARPAGPQEQ